MQQLMQQSAPMQIGGNGFANNTQTPSNLQLFYNGNGAIQFTTTQSFTGAIYAPNANIALGNSSASAPTDIFGGVVGGLVIAQNVNVHSDQALLNMNGASFMNGASYPANASSTNTSPLTHLQVVSWQESSSDTGL
jgi:hypothetical protein